MSPYIDPEKIHGGYYVPTDGLAAPVRAVRAMAKYVTDLKAGEFLEIQRLMVLKYRIIKFVEYKHLRVIMKPILCLSRLVSGHQKWEGLQTYHCP